MTELRDCVLVKWGGKTGEGIDTTGELLAHIAREAGLYVNTFRTFPSVIKGGHTSYEVHIASRPVHARGDAVDILVAFDRDSLERIRPEMADGGEVYVDDTIGAVPEDGNVVALPLTALAKAAGNVLARNMTALGLVVGLLGLDLETARRRVARAFAGKGEAVVQGNLRALEGGFQLCSGRRGGRFALPKGSASSTLFLSGNEAMAFGALAADCKLFAGYPITPATDIMEWLAARLPQFGGTLVQTEDEIAALCMVIGANFAGVRAMTASSGPGISLMTEALGLAGMTETPAVIVNVQRPGPSAGMPTKHEQGDIQHMVYASHGEVPRIVIAPGTVSDCFADMVAAFNLADRYQCPVIVASDQDLALRKQTVNRDEIDLERVAIDRGKWAVPDPSFKRYALTADGISPRAVPGQEGLLFLASGDEHDDAGRIDVEQPDVRRKMVEKRLKKLLSVDYEPLRLYGSPSMKQVVIGVGSVTGPLLEAVRRMPSLTFVQLRRLWPFPAREVGEIVKRAEAVVVVEHNAQGQLARLIRAEIGCHANLRLVRKYDGMPFTPRELLQEVCSCLA